MIWQKVSFVDLSNAVGAGVVKFGIQKIDVSGLVLSAIGPSSDAASISPTHGEPRNNTDQFTGFMMGG